MIVLQALDDDDVRRSSAACPGRRERGLGRERLTIDDDALEFLVNLANGDARFALNTLEVAATGVGATTARSPLELVQEAAQRRAATYDKSGDDHFDAISALHKTMRGSDPDAALYWLARMLERGDDPLYVARRLVRFASEDVGLADPQALRAGDGCPAGGPLHRAAGGRAGAGRAGGLPRARAEEQRDLPRLRRRRATTSTETRNDPVPIHLRNAPTGLMKDLGYGDGLPVRPRLRGRRRRPAEPAGQPGRAALLRADRSRVRTRTRATAGAHPRRSTPARMPMRSTRPPTDRR